jgi:hypothetical protein
MIGIISRWFARSVIGRTLIGGLAMLAAIFVMVLGACRSSARRECDRAEIRDLRQAAEARRRMDRADIGHGDVDDDREWLRARGGHPSSK